MESAREETLSDLRLQLRQQDGTSFLSTIKAKFSPNMEIVQGSIVPDSTHGDTIFNTHLLNNAAILKEWEQNMRNSTESEKPAVALHQGVGGLDDELILPQGIPQGSSPEHLRIALDNFVEEDEDDTGEKYVPSLIQGSSSISTGGAAVTEEDKVEAEGDEEIVLEEDDELVVEEAGEEEDFEDAMTEADVRRLAPSSPSAHAEDFGDEVLPFGDQM